MKPKIYLDYAAATPVDPAVLKAMEPYLGRKFYNPSSLYRSAREVKVVMESARAKTADILGARLTEIVFTTGATESVNLAILGVAKRFPKSGLVSAVTEHHAVLNCLGSLGKRAKLVGVNPKGLVSLEELEAAISDSTVLVSVAYANNEIGTIQPISRIGQLLKRIRSDRAKRGIDLPLYLHTDASQAACYLPLAVESLEVDLLSLGGGKIYGPPQSGMLYIRRGTGLDPILYGGGQEQGLRSGTSSAAMAVGLATALELGQGARAKESRRLTALRDHVVQALLQIPGVSLNGDAKHRLPNNINLTIEGANGEDMVLYLDEAGFEVSTGAACTAGRAEPSHVLLGIGLDEREANSSLRITLGKGTTKTDLNRLIKAMPGVIARLRQMEDDK